jgi:predicted phage tail protein
MTADVIRTVRLYGPLGVRYGRVHHLAVANAAEAVRALCAMVPGFEREMMTSKDRGVGYAVFLGKKNIGENEIYHPPGRDDIRIAPVIAGSKRGGVFNFILGAALVVASFFIPAGGAFGIAALSASAVGGLGLSLALGGLVQMLSPQPQGLAGVESPENGASYNFNGPVNVTAQGNPVPLLYGELIVGSATVSAGLYSEDQQ